MRRDYFTLEVATTGDRPTVTVAFDGPADAIGERLTGLDGADADETLDVAYRLREGGMDDDAAGVFGLARRPTGEFVLECDTTAGPVRRLVDAVRAAEGEDSYRLVVTVNGTTAVETTLTTLLVYDGEGDLLADRSLVPPGVEL